MKPFLANPHRKTLSRAKARNAAFVNLLATPGLGSLMGGRWFAGGGQILLSLVGCTLLLIWFVKLMSQYYGLMFSSAPIQSFHWPVLFVGAGLFALAWFWSLVTSISLLREASKAGLESPGTFAVQQAKLDAGQIQTALATVPQWQFNGDVIVRVFQFKDFPASLNFVNAVAELAEQAQHHPDIDIRWNKVTLALSTHNAGGLTEKDFALARQCDALSLR